MCTEVSPRHNKEIVVLRTTWACLFGCVLLAQTAARYSLDAAAEAYQEGRVGDAQQILEMLLRKQPKDPAALVLMGVVLDAERRFPDAEAYYRRALEITPSSPQTLNNAANHYLATGDRKRARALYLKTIALEPHHVNANLQLAQMCIDDKQGREAILYLDHIAAADAETSVAVLRARGLALAGQCREAGDILKQLVMPAGDASLYFSAGMAQAECRLFKGAEEAFSRALDADPRNFDILYNLGLAALRAGNVERAQSVLEVALRERPADVDTLYALAQVFEQKQQPVKSAALQKRPRRIGRTSFWSWPKCPPGWSSSRIPPPPTTAT